MIGPALEFADLQRLTGYTRIADVRRTLENQGVRVFEGKDGIWTTVQLINAAGGLAPAGDDLYPADQAA